MMLRTETTKHKKPFGGRRLTFTQLRIIHIRNLKNAHVAQCVCLNSLYINQIHEPPAQSNTDVLLFALSQLSARFCPAWRKQRWWYCRKHVRWNKTARTTVVDTAGPAPHRTAQRRTGTAPRRTAPHRTAPKPHRTTPHRSAPCRTAPNAF